MTKHLNESVLLTVCVLLSLVIHGFFLFDGFGEPDAARIGNHAILHRFDAQEYNIKRILPLYQMSIAFCLDRGVPAERLPVIMGLVNLLLGSFSIVPLYWILKRISSSLIAALSVLFYGFTPAFWFANLYGMPHLPAFFFLLCAAIAFIKVMDSCHAFFSYRILFPTGFLFIAFICKMDVVLYSGLFLGLVVVCKKGSFRNIAWALFVPCIALCSALIFVKIVAPEQTVNPGFMDTWHQRWPTDITAFKSNIPPRSVGYVFFTGAIFSCLYCIWNQTLRKYFYLAVLWSAPAVLFWCSRWGNSIRHMMIADVMVVFLLSIVIVHFIDIKRWYICVIAVLILNYFLLMPVENRCVYRGGRLFESARKIEAYHDEIRTKVVQLCQSSIDEVTIVGREDIPFVLWGLLIRYELLEISEGVHSYEFYDYKQQRWSSASSNAFIYVLRNNDGIQKTIKYLYVPLDIAILDNEIFHYWSCQPRVTLVKNHSDINVQNP